MGIFLVEGAVVLFLLCVDCFLLTLDLGISSSDGRKRRMLGVMSVVVTPWGSVGQVFLLRRMASSGAVLPAIPSLTASICEC